MPLGLLMAGLMGGETIPPVVLSARPAPVVTGGITTTATLDIGSDDPTRRVLVNITWEQNTRTITSVTLDGNAMSETPPSLTSGTVEAVAARQYVIDFPTGATAALSITFSGNPGTPGITNYTITGPNSVSYSSGGGIDTSTDMDATDPLSVSGTIPEGGAAVACAAGEIDTVAKTWTDFTEDFDIDAGTHRHCAASSTTQGAYTVTCTGGSNGEDGQLCVTVITPLT